MSDSRLIIQPSSETPVSPKRFALWALGFRPFFLAAGLFAPLLMLVFLLGYGTGIWHYNFFDLMTWHAHEMIFGFTAAVVAGFLLTSVRNWTGMATAEGGMLMALFLLWLAGRVVSAIPALSGVWVALVDSLFLLALAVVVAIPVFRAGQIHNAFVPLLLTLFAAVNGMVYAGLLGHAWFSVQEALLFGVVLIVLLLTLIGGRVIPFFIGRGISGAKVVRRRVADVAAIWGTVAFLFALPFVAPGKLALPALLLALVHAVRLSGWCVKGVWSQPLIWVLLLGYGWLIVGFALYGMAGLDLVAIPQAIHAWTAGAIGGTTLGMMARVSLGHTGRPMRVGRAMVVAFVAVHLAAAVRVLLPMLGGMWFDVAIYAAGVLWIAAFSVFFYIYFPVLIRPRMDGKPG